MAFNMKTVMPLEHHVQKDVCVTRPRYRQGRKETAVKVYTINQESKYLLIIGVPAVGAKDELESLCDNFGEVVSLRPLDDYPCEEFTETYLVCYARLHSARVAKRKLDSRSFFGGVLHVCYAPEFETPAETRTKLIERQKYVCISTHSGFTGPWDTRPGITRTNPNPSLDYANPTPAASSTMWTSSNFGEESNETTYIWAGKTYTLSQSANPQQSDSVDLSDHTASAAIEQHTVPRTESCNATRFVPRQALPSKRKFESVQLPKRPGMNSAVITSNFADSSTETAQCIRDRLSKLSVPTLDVRFKRKRLS